MHILMANQWLLLNNYYLNVNIDIIIMLIMSKMMFRLIHVHKHVAIEY